ncbi:MAG: MotA/TolQ/ExbB proton channel family protein [Verrucomicrobia bacterium]|nr:MAG: MotA/TolQ/ExbB proton channel family protein [Verrucomicrobiota bacterium]
MIPFLAQADPAVSAQATSLLAELSSPFILPLWFCSALIVYLVIELYQATAPKRFLPAAQLESARTHFRAGDYRAAYTWSGATKGVFPAAIHEGLKHATTGKTAAEDAIAAVIVGANSRFQARIAYLSVIGVIAPMVGLTGTVVGMIQAFAAMGQAGAADPSKLSGAIGHVLHATASGLVVAIPAFVFYYLLRNRVGLQLHHLSVTLNDYFRGFPYADLENVVFEGGEQIAARPAWLAGGNDVPAHPASSNR